MTGADLAAIEARIRAFETRTGVEAVAAVVERSDRYHGLRWRAFAAGASLAALGVVAADVLRPDWTGAHAALVTAVTILAVGLGCAWLATLSRPFERLFLQRERAEAEARQRAKALFLERELFATPGPIRGAPLREPVRTCRRRRRRPWLRWAHLGRGMGGRRRGDDGALHPRGRHRRVHRGS